MKDTTTALFIHTQDKDEAEKLISMNYNLISENNGTWTFENKTDAIATFADNKKLVFNNILCF